MPTALLRGCCLVVMDGHYKDFRLDILHIVGDYIISQHIVLGNVSGKTLLGRPRETGNARTLSISL